MKQPPHRAVWALVLLFLLLCGCTPPTASVPAASPTPSPVASLPQEQGGFADKRDFRLSETPLTDEDSANRYFYDMAAARYIDFGVFVTDPAFAHTAEEYAELFPGLDEVELTEAAVYSNGYYFRYRLKANANFALKTALFTGSTAYLTPQETAAYRRLQTLLHDVAQDGMTAAEKVLAVHDRIILDTVYSAEGGSPYDAVGVLLEGCGVCDGYSKAFQLCMDALGIPCQRITGTADGAAHAWNAVQLNGRWYHVDVTWDDPVIEDFSYVSHQYCLVTDAILAEDHVWEDAPVRCADESLLLFPYAGKMAETLDDLAALGETQFAADGYATLAFPDGLAADEDVVRAVGGTRYFPSFQRGGWTILVVRP